MRYLIEVSEKVLKDLDQLEIPYNLKKEEKNLENKLKENDSLDNKDISNIIDENVIYLPAPNKDGTFNINDKLDYLKEGESLYKFTFFDSQKNRAIFEIINEKDVVKRITEHPIRYISPVCQSENWPFGFYGIGARNVKKIKIQNIEPGIAHKDDQLWRITHRPIIKYLTELK